MNALRLFLLILLAGLLSMAGAVACTGSGGDDDDDTGDDDTGDDDDDSAPETCTSMCHRIEECMGDEFEDYVGTMQECIDDCEADAADNPELADCVYACDTSMDCDAYMDCLADCME